MRPDLRRCRGAFGLARSLAPPARPIEMEHGTTPDYPATGKPPTRVLPAWNIQGAYRGYTGGIQGVYRGLLTCLGGDWGRQGRPKAGKSQGNARRDEARQDTTNPKSEGRKPKETRRPKTESADSLAHERGIGSNHFRSSSFGLLSSFGLRPADFEAAGTLSRGHSELPGGLAWSGFRLRWSS